MSSKCVLYVRVSSDIQDYERQIVDLKEFALSGNFIIPNDGIFEDKLSGFKDENERPGLKNLMDYCLKNEIKFVFAWEIARLARKHLILLRLVDFFKQKSINVYFKKQNLWLLDANGYMDDRADMMISVMGWYGEYETKLMKERFHSKKKLNESQGIYNGGKVLFGFKLDETNRYIINDEKIVGLDVSEADIVREVFDYYEKGLVCSKICRICKSKGYPKVVTSTHTLARLLRNTSFIGFKDAKLGRRPTPTLIDESQFYEVNNLINQNKTKADKGRKHVYLLRGLLKCSYCNEFYVGKQTDDGYICPKNSGSNKTNKNTSCDGGNISISNIDGIIWQRTKYWLSKWKVEGFDDENLEYKSKINDLKEQINRYNNQLGDIEKQRARLNFIFKNLGSSPDEYKKEIAKNRNEKEQYSREIALLQSEINSYEKKKEEYLSIGKRIENINSINDRNQMKAIMKTLIKSIHFHKVDLFKTVIFVNYYRTRTTECLLYNSVSKKGNFFRLTYPKYFRYDKATNVFYGLKDAESVTNYTPTNVLKEHGIGENLPDYIPLSDFIQLINKHKRKDIKITKIIDYPIPDETNSFVFDFDAMMSIPDIDGFISTHKYDKIEYFKDLNKSRFNRKRRILPKDI